MTLPPTEHTRPYAVAAMMLADIQDGDTLNAHTMWLSLDPETQYRVLVVIACQVERDELTLAGMMRRVDDIAGVQ
jgi:hypothetical protein